MRSWWRGTLRNRTAPAVLTVAVGILVGCHAEPTEPEKQKTLKPSYTCRSAYECEGDGGQPGVYLTEQQAVDTSYYNYYIYDPGAQYGIDEYAFLQDPWSVSDDFFLSLPASSDAVTRQTDGDMIEVQSWTSQFGEPVASADSAQSRFLYASMRTANRGFVSSRGRARRAHLQRACDLEAAAMAAGGSGPYIPASYTTASGAVMEISCERFFNRCARRCNVFPWRWRPVCRGFCFTGFTFCKKFGGGG